MSQAEQTQPIQLLESQITRLQKITPTAGNVPGVQRIATVVLERLLGSDSKAFRDYQAIAASFGPHKDPERFRDETVHFLATVLAQLKNGVPFGYRSPAIPPTIFLGHGQSSEWLRVEKFLSSELGFRVQAFEAEPRASQHVIDILSGLLQTSDLAVIVLTAEDLTLQGEQRARQNVIHEAGLFQGRLGFSRVIILEQAGIEEPSNLAGLQTILFASRIEDAFYKLERVLRHLL